MINKENVIKAYRDLMLNRNDNTIHLTELLYCPYKRTLKQKYPDIQNINLDILEGYRFEEIIPRIFANCKISHNKTYKIKIDNEIIAFTPDFVINDSTVIECKNTSYIYFTKAIDDWLVIDNENIAIIPKQYITQLMLYLTLLKLDIGYLFILSNTRINNKLSKVLVIKEVKNQLTLEDVRNLIKAFKEDTRPRYEWECKYCQFYSVCDNEFKFNSNNANINSENNLDILLDEYILAKSNLNEYKNKVKVLEAKIKQALNNEVYENEKYKVEVKNKKIRVEKKLE
jgi:CRISPR/Cas system-associated exonuclease Cas4 (RecB family)